MSEPSKPTGDASKGEKPSSLVLQSRGSDPAQEKLLLEPFSYLTQVPGKSVRTKLLSGFNLWMGVPAQTVSDIGAIVQMLHNASLLVDDIQDNSILRRGIPVAHKIYGEASTINCANYVMFIALQRCLDLGHPDAVKVFSEQMLELHRGQGMEIYWRDNMRCPTEEEYKQMTIRKTGGLFNLAVRLMHLFNTTSKAEADFVELTRVLGLYFQIRDDYANLCLEDYATNKSFAEDLTEGKFSFPILHAIRNDPSDTKILNILRQRTTDLEVKKYCVGLLRAAGSFDYTKAVLEDLDGQVRAEIGRLGGNEKLLGLLDELKNWV